MPARPAAYRLRAPITVIAAWLVAVQTFLAGVATAQAAAMLAPASFVGTVVCHGTAAGGSDDQSAPDADKLWKLCCTFCATASAALAPGNAPEVMPTARERPPLVALARFTIIISRGAVRAGLSQAPPRLA